MKRILLFLLRFFFVKDKSFNFEDLRNYGITDNTNNNDYKDSAWALTHIGVAAAQYTGRFMIISFKDFASIMQNKDRNNITNEDLVNVSNSNVGKQLADKTHVQEFRVLFDNNLKLFKENFEYQRITRSNPDVTDALIEEINHNRLIRDTPTFVILNTLTIYYRICSTYLGYHRFIHHNEPLTSQRDLEVSNALINTFFIRSWIISITFSIIEAAYHYKSPNDLMKYNESTNKWGKLFQEIDKSLSSVVLTETKRDNLMQKIQQVLLSYPYTYVITHISKINFKSFQNTYQSYLTENNSFIDNIKSYISSHKKNFNICEFDFFLNTELSKRTSNSILDKEFIASLLYLGTETTHGFIPKSVFDFLFKHFFTCKNKRALINILKNARAANNAYTTMPPLVAFGLDDQFFDIDESMHIFRENDFIIAQNSFEPTLAGDDGFTNISDSQFCRPFLIHALFLKAVSYFHFTKPNNADLSDFLMSFDFFFEAKPYTSKKKEDITKLLISFYNEAQHYVTYKCVFDRDFTMKFEKSISDLYHMVEELELDTKKRFYSFCTINYTHGL